MKKVISIACYFLLLLLIPSFINTDSDIWTGFTNEKKLFKNLDWFRDGYRLYTPNSKVSEKLKVIPLANYKIVAFGGTWCGDTKELLPKFYKTAHNSGLRGKNISMYFLDEELTCPKGTEKNYHIVHIPTFIIFKEGKEIGRIVEKERTTIEEDLLAIIQK